MFFWAFCGAGHGVLALLLDCARILAQFQASVQQRRKAPEGREHLIRRIL